MLFEPCETIDQKARILVVGVGGAGGNALNRMIVDNLTGVEFIAINTDAQDLEENNSQTKIQIGRELTKGLGAGANSEVGRKAVEENNEILTKTLSDADMVFITAGMGGGTGTGAAPEIARIARESGALTVSIVTKPFRFEGPKRTQRAKEGIAELKKNSDTLLVIPNEILLSITDIKTTFQDSLKLADSILHQATRGISDLINIPGLINLDFADVRTIMQNMGDALLGTGIAKGEERAILAAQQAINSPLLQDIGIKGAQGILINITGPEDLTVHEINDASQIIYEEAGEDANIIPGCVIDNSLEDEIRITVIATGLNKENNELSSLNFKKEEPLVKLDYNQPKVEKKENHQSVFNNTPTYMRKQIESADGNLETPESIDSSEKQEDVLVFSDDLEVPAFIRNRNLGKS
ncbi:MAG: cell division protein FtsZ [Candidatus Marinimicrobia bacterium]|nr:cell division protein FtsZ [Candidatus Neomarinimicrobiota bacterium]|tara:strand:- start:1156 stop:2385 length:1230 start_codon:yes stop_codon:yes gene_type:complete